MILPFSRFTAPERRRLKADLTEPDFHDKHYLSFFRDRFRRLIDKGRTSDDDRTSPTAGKLGFEA
jgi:hypothetical protein